MTVKKNLIAARALIDTPEKWTKGVLEHEGCHCAFGALKPIKNWDNASTLASFLERFIPRRAALLKDKCSKLIRYNDHPTTTHADILALFDRAIAACEVEA